MEGEKKVCEYYGKMLRSIMFDLINRLLLKDIKHENYRGKCINKDTENETYIWEYDLAVCDGLLNRFFEKAEIEITEPIYSKEISAKITFFTEFNYKYRHAEIELKLRVN